MLPGLTMPPLPSPAVSKGEPPATAVLLNVILSAAAGTPGDSQFCASDQFVFRLAISAPLQVTDGRTPTGPAVSVKTTSLPTKAMVPAYDGLAVGSVPSTKLYPVMPPAASRITFVAG